MICNRNEYILKHQVYGILGSLYSFFDDAVYVCVGGVGCPPLLGVRFPGF